MGSRLIAVFVALFLTSGRAAAQVRLAEISGKVTDDSGAVLPGVTMTATQIGTGQTHDDHGVERPLPPHRIDRGRVRHSRRADRVQSGRGQRLPGRHRRERPLDLKLKVATLEETVTVDGGSAARRSHQVGSRREDRSGADRGPAGERPQLDELRDARAWCQVGRHRGGRADVRCRHRRMSKVSSTAATCRTCPPQPSTSRCRRRSSASSRSSPTGSTR